MFGYVIANQSALSGPELQRYKSCYCGLCRTIQKEYGTLQRCSLNYDMVFLVLLLQSLYEPEENSEDFRCLIHPTKHKTGISSSISSYGAAMNVALAYYKQLDDWQDDKKPIAFVLSSVFKRKLPLTQEQYPRQCQAIDQCITTLRRCEADNLQQPDTGVNAFGDLMGELFVFHEDHWAEQLRAMGSALGRYIYLLDAVLDLQEDIRKNRYNPLKDMHRNGWSTETFRPVLTMLIGECTQAFEALPLVQDLNLLRNILYSGVWSRLEWAISGKEKNHV